MDVIWNQDKDQQELQKQIHHQQKQLQVQNNQQQQQEKTEQEQEHRQQQLQQQQQQQQDQEKQQHQQQHQQHQHQQYLSDEKLNQEEVLLVHAINSVGCKNYGLTADLVEKYPYSETAGARYCDSDLKCIAREKDRSPEGLCLVRSAPLYMKGPKIATLVTQFGLGKPYEENGLAQKIVRNWTGIVRKTLETRYFRQSPYTF